MKRILTICFLLIVSASGLGAQEVFSPDRPGVSTGPGVLQKGSVIWETGAEASKDGAWNTTLPTTMLRVGISEYAELRLEYDGTLSHADDGVAYNAEPLVFGTKLHMIDGHGAIPEISFMANLAVPWTKALCDELKVAPSMYLLFENSVNEWLSIGYNVGAEWDGYGPSPETFLALCFNFGITDNFGLYAESFNYLGTSSGDFAGSFNFDAGLSYTVAPNLQVDLYGGMSIQDPAMYMVGAGIAWMIK